MKPFKLTIQAKGFFSMSIHGQIENVSVDWGDGTTDEYSNEGRITKKYNTPGEYQISIYADKLSLDFFTTGIYTKKIQSIDQWGDIRWQSMRNMFTSAENMNLEANDTPNMEEVENMRGMFEDCKSFNGDISNWDVSNVEHMSYLFTGAKKFNQDISKWNVSNVRDMSHMFHDAKSFNQDLNNWDTSSMEIMPYIFSRAKSFNGDISEWDVSNVKSMKRAFKRAESFNQDLTSWNIQPKCDVEEMFKKAHAIETENIPNIVIIKKI